MTNIECSFSQPFTYSARMKTWPGTGAISCISQTRAKNRIVFFVKSSHTCGNGFFPCRSCSPQSPIISSISAHSRTQFYAFTWCVRYLENDYGIYGYKVRHPNDYLKCDRVVDIKCKRSIYYRKNDYSHYRMAKATKSRSLISYQFAM